MTTVIPMPGITVASEFLSTSSFVPTAEAIGFSVGTRNGSTDSGVIEWDADGNSGAGLNSLLSGITFAPGSSQTLTLEVESDGSYDATYDDGVAVTPIMVSGTTDIDLTQTYFFRARTQGASDNFIQSVTLTTDSAQFSNPTIETSNTVHDLGTPIDLNITFDPSADTAILTTPAGNVDLVAIDAGDTTPNDGIVTLQDSPAAAGFNSYVVTATRTGTPDLSADVELLVIDPAGDCLLYTSPSPRDS